MPDVSFCLIACNEEVRLEQCLGSVREFCRELLVIDTGSNDNTAARARELGADVRSFEWTDDFAEARNYGLSHLTGEWVLMLDADEHLLPRAITDIKEQLKNPDHLVINLLRREVGAVQSPWSLVSRLFRRHPDIRFERPYHAMVDDSVERLLLREPHWQIHDLHTPAIAHEGYRPEEIAGQGKAARARRAMERYHAQHPEDPYVCSKLGALLQSLGETTEAESMLQTGLRSVDNSPASAHLRHELYYHLGLLYRARNEWDKARRNYRMALEQGLDPRLTVGAAFNLAALDQQEGRIDEAIHSFNQVLKLVPDLAQAHVNLGLAHRAKGHDQRAKSHYLQALQIDPNHADAHRNLGVLQLHEGRTNKAMRCFTKALDCYKRQSPEEAVRFRNLLNQSGINL